MNASITTLWIALGGALGTASRYWIGIWVLPLSRGLPWGTIGINIVGSFVIGFFAALMVFDRHPMPETARLFVTVGVCGGFTTFSSFSLQTLDLLRQGAWTRALANVALSLLLCLAAVAVGQALGMRLKDGPRTVLQTMAPEAL